LARRIARLIQSGQSPRPHCAAAPPPFRLHRPLFGNAALARYTTLLALDSTPSAARRAVASVDPPHATRPFSLRDSGKNGAMTFLRDVDFRIVGNLGFYVHRLSATLAPTQAGTPIVFDDPTSFGIDVHHGTVTLGSAKLTALFDTSIFGYRHAPLRKLVHGRRRRNPPARRDAARRPRRMTRDLLRSASTRRSRRAAPDATRQHRRCRPARLPA